MLEENKALVRGFTVQIDNGNLDEAFELLTSDDAWHGPHGKMDQEAFKGFFSAALLALPDFSNTIEDQIAEGDLVVSRTTIRGTHKAQFRSIAPIDRHATVSEITIDRFPAGKIIERWVVFDALGLMRQLGAVPDN